MRLYIGGSMQWRHVGKEEKPNDRSWPWMLWKQTQPAQHTVYDNSSTVCVSIFNVVSVELLFHHQAKPLLNHSILFHACFPRCCNVLYICIHTDDVYNINTLTASKMYTFIKLDTKIWDFWNLDIHYTLNFGVSKVFWLQYGCTKMH